MTQPMPDISTSTSEIPEVAEFEEADHMLRTFMEEHKDVFHRYEQLAGQYNQRRQAADKAVRAADVTCGPWNRFSQQIKINWKGLYDYLGGDKEKFMSVGGSISRVTQYTGSREELEVRIASGEIPEEEAEAFRTISGRYKKPDAITLP